MKSKIANFKIFKFHEFCAKLATNDKDAKYSIFFLCLRSRLLPFKAREVSTPFIARLPYPLFYFPATRFKQKIYFLVILIVTEQLVRENCCTGVVVVVVVVVVEVGVVSPEIREAFATLRRLLSHIYPSTTLSLFHPPMRFKLVIVIPASAASVAPVTLNACPV